MASTGSAGDEEKLLKIVVCGDDGVGKTCLLVSFATNTFPKAGKSGTRQVMDTYITQMEVNEQSHTLELWDTTGGKEYDDLRPLTYADADLLLACFNLSDRESFENLTTKWLPEIRQHGERAPFIIVGTKSDLISSRQVSRTEAKELALKEGAGDYIETSALSRKNLDILFDVSVRKCKGLNHHQKLFADTIREDEPVTWRRSKLMIVGPKNSGKTSLVRSLLRDSNNVKVEPTIGATITSVAARGNEWSFSDVGIPYTTELATWAGIKRFVDKKQNTMKRGLMRRSIRMIRSSISLSPNSKNKKPPLFEPDAIPQVFNQALFLEKLREHQNHINTLTYEIWDFGGEKVLQNFNDLFLTQNSVCILVFDMREVLNDKSGSYCKNVLNWLNRIDSYAPDTPIILAGSFLDSVKLKRDWDKISQTLGKRLKLAENFENISKIDGRWFIPISNTKNKNTFGGLRNEIGRVTSKQKIVNEPISMRWTKVLDDLMEENEKPWISLLDVYEIGTINGLRNSEVDAMLRFFNETGILVYIPFTDALRSIVILEPQWLINQFGKVIRNGEVLPLRESVSNEKLIQKSGYEKFLDSGLASRGLLSLLWEDKQTTDFMMELMRHTLLISNWNFTVATGESEYVMIPCMTMNANSTINMGKSPSVYAYGVKEPIIGKNEAKVWFGACDVIYLQNQGDRITLAVEIGNKSTLSLYRCLNMIKAMLSKINQDFVNGELSWNLEFEDGIPYEKAKKKKKLQNWFAENSGNVRTGLGREDLHRDIPVRDVDLQLFLESLRDVQVI